MNTTIRYLALAVLVLLISHSLISHSLISHSLISHALAADDILIADFEGSDYGPWKVEGEAFGPGPAQGTLPRQMKVSGYQGHGLVNSFYGGDKSTGTLTSEPFTIQRRHLNFLIGGGAHPGKTCVNLLVDGQIVRAAAGPNDRPGGSERLDWHSWDVGELQGQEAIVQIVDRHGGGWGHVNVDQIIQSDRHMGLVETRRDMALEHDYLGFQFKAGDDARTQVSLIVDEQTVRHATGPDLAEPCWMTWDVSRLQDEQATLRTVERPGPDGERTLAQSVFLGDESRGTLVVVDTLYAESYRPQFHFTPKQNWTNDPNGLTFYDGEYHLFFQHNPVDVKWGNMTWGHAISRDLIHWEQLEHAIPPDEHGTIFSGSAVVDSRNTSGFQTGPHPPLVCVFTYAGRFSDPQVPFTQGIAYSVDRGRTFTKYEKPVLENLGPSNRDPKVFWHEPTGQWVMVLYLGTRGDFVLMGSKNLRQWTKLDDVPFPEGHECPELFELPVDDDPADTRWVFWEGGGRHIIGRFDGKSFTPESEVLPSEWARNCYAGQTWNDTPAGRRVFIGWMRGGKYPGMPFNQQMSFPRVFQLRTTDEGIRLFARPIREIENLYVKEHAFSDMSLEPGDNPLRELEGELWDLDAVLEPCSAEAIELTLRGQRIRYESSEGMLSCMGRSVEVRPVDGQLKLRVLVDRTSIEVFAADGRYVLSQCFVPDLLDRRISLTAVGEGAKVHSLVVRELRSIWEGQVGGPYGPDAPEGMEKP